MFLLDTNVISELRRPEKADRRVFAWADAIPSINFFVSVVSVLEIEIGTLQLARRDFARAAQLRLWIDEQILPKFGERILPIDTVVAQRCASLYVPHRHSEHDALIAATALVHGLTVVTRNVRDFAAIDVALLNPWDTPAT